MRSKPTMNNKDIKNDLYQMLLADHAFWSFDMSSQTDIPDDILIEKTIIHLDIEEIVLLFKVFKKPYIKKVWRDKIVIQGDYYRDLNRLMAWMFFDIKQPERYIKTVITKHLNKLYKG